MQHVHGPRIRVNMKSIITAFMLCFAAGAGQVQAAFDPVNDDTDIFLANPSVDANRPNVLLFIDNTANWNTAFDSEKAALVDVINGLGDTYNVGTMLFPETGSPNDSVDGGNVRFAIRQMTDANKSVMSSIYSNFDKNNDKGNNATPALGMLEVYRYFSGGHSRSTYGKIKSDYTGNATHETVTPVDLGNHALPSNPNALSDFNSPIADACQDNFIIYISNGPANENTNALDVSETELASLGYDTSSTIAISPNGQEGNWMDEWADYLANADINSDFDGDQHVYTYVIEVDPSTTGQGPAMTALLKSAAAKGKGEYFAVSSGSGGSAIVDALNDIFSEIQAINSVFASTTLPVSVNVRGTNLNQVYIGVFRPDEHKAPRWYGNLKMYQLGFDSTTNTLFLEDAAGAEAENPVTGFINSTGESFWTHDSTFWSYRDAAQNGDGGDSDLPDGDLVEKGGAAQQQRDDYAVNQSLRNLYTCNATSTATCSSGSSLSDFPFSTANDGITASDLDLATIDVSSLSATENKNITSLTDTLTVGSLNTSPIGGSIHVTLDVGSLNTVNISSITTQQSAGISAIDDGLASTTFTSLDYCAANNKRTACATTADDLTSLWGVAVNDTVNNVRIAGVSDTDYNGLETVTITGTNSFTYVPTGNNLSHIPNNSYYSSATASISTTGNLITITSTSALPTAGSSISLRGLSPTSYNSNFQVQTVSGSTFTVNTASTLAPLTTSDFSSASFSYFSTKATVTTATAHNFANGTYVLISGAVPNNYNNTWKITSVPSTTSFTFNAGAQLADATTTGTASQDADNTVTATVTAPSTAHSFADNTDVNISGGNPGGFNGSFTISNPGASTTSFTYNTLTKQPPNTGTSVTASSGFSTQAVLSITDHNLYPFRDINGDVSIIVEGVTGVDGGTGDAMDYTDGGNVIEAKIVDDNTLTYSTANGNAPGPALGNVTVRIADLDGQFSTGEEFVAFATIPGHGYGNDQKGADGIWNTLDDLVTPNTVTLSISGADNAEYNEADITAYVLDNNTIYYGLSRTTHTVPTAMALGDDTGSPIASVKTTTATARAVSHGFSVGDSVDITGASPSVFNNTWTVVSVPDVNTFTFDLTEKSVGPQGDATGTIKASTGTAASGELANIINWVRGQDDFEDENKNSSTTDVRASIHGDVLHSRPAIVNYNRYGNDDDVYVFYGANDGVFRAVKGGFNNAGGTEPDPGHEAWGFIPEEFFSKLKRLRNDEPTISSSNKKPYFADGSIGVLSEDNSGPGGPNVPDDKLDTTVDDNSNPDRVYIYITMRRGGRMLYALDVSDPSDPKYLWKIDNTTTGFGELGQTWSAPRVLHVEGYDDPVLLFGAGYDPNVEDIDPNTITSVDPTDGSVTTAAGTTDRSMGRGIFVIDAYTGALLWQAGRPGADPSVGKPYVEVPDMIYAIPSDMTAIRTGVYDDRAYVGDTGGNVWRIDLPDADSDGDNTPDFLDWTVSKLADVVPDDSPSCTAPCDPITIPDDLRKFEQAPDVVLGDADSQYPNGYYAVLLGSGDREHPFDENVKNRFYMFKDRVNPASSTTPLIDNYSYDANGTNDLTATNTATLVEGNLFNATKDCIDDPSACGTVSSLVDTTLVDLSADSTTAGLTGASTVTSDQASTLATLASGWYINLNAGEKVTGNAVTLNKVTFFNTNQPSSTSETSDCSSDLGIARQYQVTFSDATAFEDKPGGAEGLDAQDRSQIHAGGGYLPAPVPLVVEINGEIHEGVISGVSVGQPPGSLLNARLRKFWYREMDSN